MQDSDIDGTLGVKMVAPGIPTVQVQAPALTDALAHLAYTNDFALFWVFLVLGMIWLRLGRIVVAIENRNQPEPCGKERQAKPA